MIGSFKGELGKFMDDQWLLAIVTSASYGCKAPNTGTSPSGQSLEGDLLENPILCCHEFQGQKLGYKCNKYIVQNNFHV